MHIEYVSAHHDKSDHPAYVMVPKIAVAILKDIPSISGFVFGGSYANGKYAWGEDIDFDVLFEKYPPAFNRDMVEFPIRKTFSQLSFSAHMRAPLAANTISAEMRKLSYLTHPRTPFVVRDSKIAEAWGLK